MVHIKLLSFDYGIIKFGTTRIVTCFFNWLFLESKYDLYCHYLCPLPPKINQIKKMFTDVLSYPTTKICPMKQLNCQKNIEN